MKNKYLFSLLLVGILSGCNIDIPFDLGFGNNTLNPSGESSSLEESSTSVASSTSSSSESSNDSSSSS